VRLKDYMFPKGSKRVRYEINDVVFIDPGLEGTGWAYWARLFTKGHPTPPPFSAGTITSRIKTSWEAKASDICAQLAGVLAALPLSVVVIEMSELRGDSTSYASAKSGSLFKLTYLIGAMSQVCQAKIHCTPILVKSAEWKGQLPKDLVVKRFLKAFPSFEKARGKKIRNHEGDALGMGLAAMGRL